MKDKQHQTDYADFLATKRLVVKGSGKNVSDSNINPLLFPFQRDLTRWAVLKGRAAIFADTGLGKTFMQLEWARLSEEKTLIVAPLSVARQTVNEAHKIDIDVHYSRDGSMPGQITITNYEMVDKFDPGEIGAIVLDESSILKSLTSKTRAKLIAMFNQVPYRLACTATPAPNDITEIANHAEFLGVMSRVEMLAAFFVHDDEGWRLKGHAQNAFFRWMASWGMSIRKPSDLGYEDDGYILPPLNTHMVEVKSDYVPDGQLFFISLHGVSERQAVRRETLKERCQVAAALIDGSDEQWIFWCGLNDESSELARLMPNAAEVIGSQSLETKLELIEGFQDGQYQILITKPSIAGMGMNFQNANNMAFVGLNDSFEAYYQAVRRCWRFGQNKPVDVYIVLSDIEQAIFENVKQKERTALHMSEELIANVQEYEKEELTVNTHEEFEYVEDTITTEEYTLMLGDSAKRMPEIENDSIGLSVFSPPFISLYTYSPTERDLGNSKPGEFFEHFRFIIDELLRVTKPGRNCAVHVQQVSTKKFIDGYIGLRDFRGDVIRAFEKSGWHYYGEVCIDKDPQAQAIRTKAKTLMFIQLERDASAMRPALADYIIIFQKPGENEVPVLPVQNGDMTREDWIQWARPIWYDIKESDTLNFRMARADKDERHICPLQLGTIERCIKLWSNQGDVILSPFMGIGSEGYEAIRLRRKFIGIELKPEYFKWGAENIAQALTSRDAINLFEFAGIEIE